MNQPQDDEHTVLASTAPGNVPPTDGPPTDGPPTDGPSTAGAPTDGPPAEGPPGHEDDTVLPIGTRLGDFEVVGLLGVGGFGIVYRAHDSFLDRDVALKEYMPSSLASRSQSHVHVKSARHADMFQAGLRSFINEARMLAHFDHPALVKVYQFWEANGTAYMVMPYYRGKTLKQALAARTGPPDEAWLKKLLTQLLDALELIHEEQCFHRDIAPDNILMLDDARPLLLDFGAARHAIEGMTQAFTVILKQGYAPIEQYAETPGMRQGAWTDLYALASVVHYAIDGRPPAAAVARIIADPFVPMASRFADRYSASFLAAIDQALAVKADQRPQSVADMRMLLGLDDGAAVTAMRPATSFPQAASAPAASPPPVAPASVAAPLPATLAPAASPAAPSAALPLPGDPAPAMSPAPPVSPAAGGQRTRSHALLYSGAAAAVLVAAGLGYFIVDRRAPTPAPAIAQAPSAEPGAAEPTAAEPVAAAPTTATPTTAALPPAAQEGGTFEPVAALGHIVAGADANRMITVQVEKSRVRIGQDALAFSVRASHAGYVYVYMVGSDRNNFWLLFPNAFTRANAIRAGETMKLPGSARGKGRWRMDAGGPPGIDHLVVMVSDAPRNFDAAGLVTGESFAEFPIARAAQLQRAHTGTTPLFAGVADCAGATCPATYGATAFEIEEVDR